MLKLNQMNEEEYYSNFLGSSAANFAFMMLLGLCAYLRKRLNKSSCASHCGIFDCEAQLQELQHVKDQVVTQRGMIQTVLNILDNTSILTKPVDNDSPVLLYTPEKKQGGNQPKAL